MSSNWVSGLYEDNWVASEGALKLKNVRSVSMMVYLPESDLSAKSKILKVVVDQLNSRDFVLERGKVTEITLKIPETKKGFSFVYFRTEPELNTEEDSRDLGFLLTECDFEVAEEIGGVNESHTGSDVVKYFVFPDYTKTNPYQKMIELSLPENYETFYDTIDQAISHLFNLSQSASGQRAVFHLHWTSHVLSHCSSLPEAKKAVERFLAKVRLFKKLGGRVIWTIHNTVPHDAVFVDREVELREGLSEISDVVHVHSKGSIPEIQAQFKLREDNLVFIPHPSYKGVYPNYISRDAAREVLGLAEDEFCFLFLGQVRPYKGLDSLLDAVKKLSSEGLSFKLIIAGKPVFPYSSDVVNALISSSENVIFVDGFIKDEELQIYFSASDVAVYPYRSILTSGSVLSAISFGTPVIAPAYAAIKGVVKNGKTGWTYSPNSEGLSLAMSKALAGRAELESMSDSCNVLAEKLTWKKFTSSLSRAIAKSFKEPNYSLSDDLAGVDLIYSKNTAVFISSESVAIVVVSYRSIKDLRVLFDSLQGSLDDNFTVYLVDNFSANIDNREFDVLIQRYDFDIKLYRLSKNTGYAQGNNIGARVAIESGHELIWLLNPDTVVEPDTLQVLRGFAKDTPSAKLIAPVVLNNKRERKVWSAGGHLSFEGGVNTNHLYSGASEVLVPNEPYNADYVSGASILCRADVFRDVGYIPEEYFLYYEETDWCLSVREKLGDVIFVCPDAKMYHHKSSEMNGLPSRYYFYYYIRNSINFTRKFSPNSIEDTISRVRREFIQPWMKKIEKRDASIWSEFHTIAETAVSDGVAGVLGQKAVFQQVKPVEDYSSPPVIDSSSHNELVFKLQQNSDGELPEVLSLIVDEYGVGEFGVGDLTMKEGQVFGRMLLPRSIDFTSPKLVRIAQADNKISEGVFVYNSAAAEYRGRIDGVASYQLKGWALDETAPDSQLDIDVFWNGEMVASGKAIKFRPDLLRAGIGTGHHGFLINLPLKCLNGEVSKVSVEVSGTGKTLYSRDLQCHFPVKPLINAPLARQEEALFYCREVRYDQGVELIEKYSSVGQLWQDHFGVKPKVSVIMPAYNRQDTILRSIKSVLEQSYENIELVIVDDGSVDGTVDIIEELITQDNRGVISLITLTDNVGVSKARNVGLQAASGEVIAYLDSDNSWKSTYLETMVSTLEQTNKSACYCAQLIYQTYFLEEKRVEEPVVVRGGRFSLSQLSNRNFIDLNCYVHKRVLYDELGGFNEEMTRLVDWELILKYSIRESPVFVPSLLSEYFMDRADNQITRVADFEGNLDALEKAKSSFKIQNSEISSLRNIHLVVVISEYHEKLKAVVERSAASAGAGGMSVLVTSLNEKKLKDLKEDPDLVGVNFYQTSESFGIGSALAVVAKKCVENNCFVGLVTEKVVVKHGVWQILANSLIVHDQATLVSPSILVPSNKAVIENMKYLRGPFPIPINSQPYNAINSNKEMNTYLSHEISQDCFLISSKKLMFEVGNISFHDTWGSFCDELKGGVVSSNGIILVNENVVAKSIA